MASWGVDGGVPFVGRKPGLAKEMISNHLTIPSLLVAIRVRPSAYRDDQD